ncbi:hypothetical protein [Marinicella sp. W31]|uniref:hypothetical protein n=1 Tax=Marinicella sp. W31 TaxID=3023713 RepID=UPI003756E924
MVYKKIYFIVVMSLSFSLQAKVEPSLLKNFKADLPQDVRTLLEAYADKNHLLNGDDLQQAAFLAAKYKEWAIAGFYHIANSIRMGVDLRVYDFKVPAILKNEVSFKRLFGDKKALTKAMLESKELRGFFDEMGTRDDLSKKIQIITLHLVKNVDVLEQSVFLYEKWTPSFSDKYHPHFKFSNKRSESAAGSEFKAMNVDYKQSNRDIIKLLKIPRYKELKVADLEQREEIFKLLMARNNRDNPKLQASFARSHEMEKIELDNLLFTENNWGGWFR